MATAFSYLGQKASLNLNSSNYPILWFSVPETEQGLANAARSKVTISFTPHLIPMVRVAP